MYIHSIGACVGRDGSGSHYITEVKKKKQPAPLGELNG